jgi:hypothetical protein
MLPEVTEGPRGLHPCHRDDRRLVGEWCSSSSCAISNWTGWPQKGEILRSRLRRGAGRPSRAPRSPATIKPQYRNMRYWLEKDMTPVDLARDACRDLGIEPVSVPIRGGTDGSRLTEMGVPCPNLFTGMQEIHGPLEWISVQDMAQATRADAWASRAAPAEGHERSPRPICARFL